MEAERLVEMCLDKMKVDFKYQMFYNPSIPKSLVMLKDPEFIPKINKTKSDKTNYLWISSELTKAQEQLINEISDELQIKIIHF